MPPRVSGHAEPFSNSGMPLHGVLNRVLGRTSSFSYCAKHAVDVDGCSQNEAEACEALLGLTVWLMPTVEQEMVPPLGNGQPQADIVGPVFYLGMQLQGLHK
jgi:hypothetical protein